MAARARPAGWPAWRAGVGCSAVIPSRLSLHCGSSRLDSRLFFFLFVSLFPQQLFSARASCVGRCIRPAASAGKVTPRIPSSLRHRPTMRPPAPMQSRSGCCRASPTPVIGDACHRCSLDSVNGHGGRRRGAAPAAAHGGQLFPSSLSVCHAARASFVVGAAGVRMTATVWQSRMVGGVARRSRP